VLTGLRFKHRGFTMLELIVVVAIVAILASLAMPSFSTMIQNSQIRNAAESIQNGLQLARAEAVRRNTTIGFQFTTSLDNTCALSTTDSNWIISSGDPTGLCASAPINEAFPITDTTNNPAPGIIQKRATSEGSRNAVVAADQTSITFNATGRVSPVPATNININISNPSGGVCASASGPMRCLRVVITTAGQVRMCNPAIANTDPRGC